ncbi:SIS domain-containing protein [Ahrensia sp. R2A130]|uniref:SIS domain-containing protein n=1 Tax=Ahrensia sp. R2A130 TaxID=744979 RepID=UPI0001E08C30|nr:SIS domain-containing protein [Ahrensia sp. R2A130]EFL89534.1 phosphoheptose isomerase [Ahrensia sp. R2A130]
MSEQKGMEDAGGGGRPYLSNSLPLASNDHFTDYATRMNEAMMGFDWTPVSQLTNDLMDLARDGRQLFLCGNGGSAGNANHLANDFLYAWSKKAGRGIRVQSLAANPAVMACLANDVGFEEVFANQLQILAREGDVLLCFSGSGNSPNILRVLEEAKAMGVKTYSVLAFDGGKAKALSDVPIHLEIDDMQIGEDFQTVIGHAIVQYMFKHRDLLGPDPARGA